MNTRQQNAINGFSAAVKELKDAGVIRSDRYLGDIAEFLCADVYKIDLATNLRQGGHDGHREGSPVQIKYGGGKKLNVDLGNPERYEEIYVVLGKKSKVRPAGHGADFVIHKFTSEEVRKMRTKSQAFSCGSKAFKRKPDHVIHLHGWLGRAP